MLHPERAFRYSRASLLMLEATMAEHLQLREDLAAHRWELNFGFEEQ